MHAMQFNNTFIKKFQIQNACHSSTCNSDSESNEFFELSREVHDKNRKIEDAVDGEAFNENYID
jgi:hypothetical protein